MFAHVRAVASDMEYGSIIGTKMQWQPCSRKVKLGPDTRLPERYFYKRLFIEDFYVASFLWYLKVEEDNDVKGLNAFQRNKLCKI